ncbi:aminomethyl-transferring glycine dehydrogenase [Uliginosibacterium sp. H1]|uniref:aminomethyl-transferring glycine dehydrogenase n=1 Tax=Uliginosibacterium sp. H1 TaxID=3114757 RepID=UPI002E172C6E|nr:aminomethyl-transferring glycine dehydrogenase [Uliginosibacterium sp. H1]
MPHTSASSLPLSVLEQHDAFIARHIGPDEAERADMLASLGVQSLDTLIAQTVPAAIRLEQPLPIADAVSEEEALGQLRALASQNVIKKSLIGLGYYGTLTPKVILRNVMENPGWYTAYTPYQAEIAQGRLEALLNWQQMVCDLTGMTLANASLLDEATAAAEAMTMARRVSKSKSNAFFVDEAVFPQTLDVVRTRATYFGYELIVATASEAANHDVFGVLLQNPNAQGEVQDFSALIASVKAKGAIVAVATDLMASVLVKSAGGMGADIAFGSAQRFGVPMGFGGPHAAFFATHESNARSMPGRIIGVSKDVRGKTALRMALQTREQHIRREKANSNICTSQVLLANMAGFYAVYHGPQGLRTIASRINRLAAIFSAGVQKAGFKLGTKVFFDTLTVATGTQSATIFANAASAGFNLRQVTPSVLGLSFDETHTRDDVLALLNLFADVGRAANVCELTAPFSAADIDALDTQVAGSDALAAVLREDAILTHPVFNTHHTEHAMLRYLKKLQNRDLALDHSMISLGSCTMKLNATSEMIPVTWPEFGALHPFVPRDQAKGYLAMIEGLADYLRAVTGFPAICMQPNSGAQGEYAGLVAIRRYQQANGQGHRDICLIPKSAHGTNPATAQMCGLEVVVVNCDDNGNVEVADLKARIAQHKDRLSTLMVTYPSTHGVFEEAIKEICALVHEAGGQVYMDGANLNAQVGLTSPATIGADVSHMNLHKTFCIPHGGGGPGMGPIGLAAHLAPYMADHVVAATGDDDRPNAGQGAVSAAPFGSASILPISWMYITMMGGTGLKQATEVAILNANYIANALKDDYPVLYVGSQGRVAHECILDIRPIKAATGVTEVDIAKRLMDYGFHAPTMSFPVAGTIMVEPTESEPKAELDRFIAAMRAIREEIRAVESGKWTAEANPLKHAPHTQADIMGEWERPYAREQAVFPLAWIADNKFWPSVNRIDDVYGDRNLFCACVPMSEYES